MTTQRQRRKTKAKLYETCIVCGKTKSTPKLLQKGVPRSEYERDPYCSATCCKLDHDLTSPSSPTSS